ncbi:hypothetical protein GCM10023237_01790 [Streptomyces coeruleoprunus]
MYGGIPVAGVLGIGGSSALAARRDGFQALATVVAATTLLMAGVSLSKLVPRRRPAPYCPPGARSAVPTGPSSPDHPGQARQGLPTPTRSSSSVPPPTITSRMKPTPSA